MSNEQIPETLKTYLEEQGYKYLSVVPNRGVCGLMQMAFTVGLFYGLDEDSYIGRYCFPNEGSALLNYAKWITANGEGDPPGNWIKHKGYKESEYQIKSKIIPVFFILNIVL